MAANVLYLSFDGMTDPLGRSQILPYLVGLAGRGHRIRIVSLEKAALFDRGKRAVEEICQKTGLSWHPFPYRTGPPILSAMLNLRTLRRASERLFDEQRSDILHCRSYPPAVIGLSLKRRSGCPLIFDMRGFWPDSRREGGRWRSDRMLGRFLFRRWKNHEAELIAEADHIVTLTNAARLAVEGWDSYHGAPISVVPCCADFDLFGPSSVEERARMRRELGFGDSDPILVYLGSIGTVYRLRDHLRLFAAVRRRNAAVKMLFVGRATIEEIEAEARQIGIALEPSEVRQLTAERDQVARLVSVGDVGTNFYSPTFSSLGVSPTKLGEYLACGVPAIANAHVGDVQAILEATGGGHVLPNFSDDEIEKAADAFFRLREMDRDALRSRARAFLDLPNGVKAYCRIYDDLSTPVRADSRSDANGRDLAIFDLCDTLAATNTTFAFLDFYAAIGSDPARKKTFDRWTSRRSPLFYAAAVIQRITGADIARQRVIAQLAGEKRETIMGAAIRFSKEILPSLMNEPLLRRLAAHKSAGDQVLIVSSSLDVIVAPISAHLDVQFLASTLGFDGERCTGRIEHDLTRSKLAALRERGLLGKRSIHVYTDNRSDAQLLEVAQHRNIVLPRGRGNHRWGGADCEYIEL